jgi:hypothetical protein
LNKKSYISLLFLLAFSVLFTHSVIPHHHNDDHITQQAGNHHNDNDDDHDMDHNPLSHAFGSFHHEQGGAVINEPSSPTVQYCKINLDKEIVVRIHHFINSIEKPPLIHSGQYLFSPLKNLYLDNKHFRGPPAAQA